MKKGYIYKMKKGYIRNWNKMIESSEIWFIKVKSIHLNYRINFVRKYYQDSKIKQEIKCFSRKVNASKKDFLYFQILYIQNLKLVSHVVSISSVKSFSGSEIVRLKLGPFLRT